jgi:predicted AlkP superfamily pyrophosphatase or phosphodiesterase
LPAQHAAGCSHSVRILVTSQQRRVANVRIALLAFALVAPPLLAQQGPAPVILLSVYGLRPAAVLQAQQHGLRVPVLRSFVEQGTYADGVVGVLPTLTYPSHTTLVTGVSPATHGIYSNTTFDPLFQNQVGWHWYAEDEHAPTLWAAAHQRGLLTASMNWPVTVDAPGLDWNLPEFSRCCARSGQIRRTASIRW